MKNLTKRKNKHSSCIEFEKSGDNFPEISIRILPLHNTEACLAERIPQCQEE